MLLKRITLNNYGPYSGRHRFDLDATEERPLIIIGALNGGGKTTLFESVRLCLYGRYPARSRQRQYERKLAELIHRAPAPKMLDAERAASVTVEFLLYQNGTVTEFMVERAWHAVKDGISERLLIKKRGEGDAEFCDLDDVEKDQWQSFVNGMIPPGISDLFFFDGEKVVQMAQEYDIKSSLNSLLGIDIVERLQADLKVNLMRNLEGDDKALAANFEELSRKKSRAEENAERLKESRIRKEEDLKHARVLIEEAEAKLESMGGGFAQKRHDIKARLEAKRTQMAALSETLSNLCAAELPLSVAPDQTADVISRMDQDAALAQQRVRDDMIKEVMHKVRAGLAAAGPLSRIEESERERVSSDIISSVEGSLRKTPRIGGTETFGFSTKQQERIRGVIDAANGAAIQDAREAAATYGQVREEASSLERALASAPADDEIGPIISKIAELNREAGRLEGEIDHIESGISSEEAHIKLLDSKIREIRASQYKNKKNRRRANLTVKIQRTLEEYAGQLRRRKIALLESYVAEAMATLMHKRDFIKSVRIDPESFAITIYDARKDQIPLPTISQGERQMLSMSILWGLARASGRPLPFMIDTPLARLDAEHRANLIERFFPLASHQILLFSTDAEIGRAEYRRLAPYISGSYTIKYDSESRQSGERPGYFWEDV